MPRTTTCRFSTKEFLSPRCPFSRLDFALTVEGREVTNNNSTGAFKACSGDMSEVIMSVRASMALLLFSLLLGPQAQAKNKKKQQLLPDQVLKATTVLVLIHSEMGEP